MRPLTVCISLISESLLFKPGFGVDPVKCKRHTEYIFTSPVEEYNFQPWKRVCVNRLYAAVNDV